MIENVCVQRIIYHKEWNQRIHIQNMHTAATSDDNDDDDDDVGFCFSFSFIY